MIIRQDLQTDTREHYFKYNSTLLFAQPSPEHAFYPIFMNAPHSPKTCAKKAIKMLKNKLKFNLNFFQLVKKSQVLLMRNCVFKINSSIRPMAKSDLKKSHIK